MDIAIRCAISTLCAALAGCCIPSTGSSGPVTAAPGGQTFFPGPGDFQGTYTPPPGQVLNGLQSTYDGTIVVSMVERWKVEKIIATGLRLAQLLVPNGMHPVIHLIGDQREPACIGFCLPVEFPESGYREMIFLVPFVVSNLGTNWHNYTVRMYLDHWLPVWGGNTFYGYNKRPGELKETRIDDVVHHEVTSDTALRFRGDIQSDGAWSPVAQPPPRWADLKRIFEMPILGTTDTIYICSYWEWSFGTTEIAPAGSTHEVVTRFVAEMADWENTVMSSATDGAVSVRHMRWRLGAPFPCEF